MSVKRGAVASKRLHSSILAWRISWTEDPGILWPTGLQASDVTEATEHTRACEIENDVGDLVGPRWLGWTNESSLLFGTRGVENSGQKEFKTEVVME